MTRALRGLGEERALERLKATYNTIAPSDAARRRVYARAHERASEPRQGFRPAIFAWCATGAAAMVVAFVFFNSREPAPPIQSAKIENGNGFRTLVSSVSGRVELSSAIDGAHCPAATGVDLVAGSSITTARRSATALSIGPHRVAVGTDTLLLLDQLEPEELRFHLESGSAEFAVDPLPVGGSLTVTAGALVVEVVGTVFRVERDAHCTRVQVTCGTVRTFAEGKAADVPAGQSLEVCSSPSSTEPDPGQNDAVGASPEDDGMTAQLSSRAGSATRTRAADEGGEHLVQHEARADKPADASAERSPVAASTSSALIATAATEEEALYRAALDLRTAGDIPRCRKAMGEYVAQYPRGTFTEEALFALVRLDYRARDDKALIDHAIALLERRTTLDAKAAEVRVLYAESQLRLGGDGQSALSILAPFDGSLGPLPPHFQEQAAYLLTRAAMVAGERDLAHKHANAYLARFPKGRYAASAQEILKKIAAP